MTDTDATEPDELVRLGKDNQGQERWTTKEMLAIEAQMLKNAQALSERERGKIEDQVLEITLAKRSLSQEQAAALRYITEDGDLKCVLGYAGTGKSYLLGGAKEVWEEAGYRVRGVALSGVAAQNLHQSSGIESRTAASLFYGWDKGRHELSVQDVLVIDEAGMLGSRQMERIITQAQDKRAKIVMVGDPQQLQAIDAGAAFRALAQDRHLEQRADFYETRAKAFLEVKYREEKDKFWQEADKFLTKFEKARPDVARRICDSLIPEHEKQAAVYVHQFKAYHGQLSGLTSKERQAFAKLTKEMMDSPVVMNHIGCRDEDLARQIKETFQQQQRASSISYECAFSRGLSW